MQIFQQKKVIYFTFLSKKAKKARVYASFSYREFKLCD